MSLSFFHHQNFFSTRFFIFFNFGRLRVTCLVVFEKAIWWFVSSPVIKLFFHLKFDRFVLDVSIARCLLMEKTYWFDYQFYRGLSVNIQPHNWCQARRNKKNSGGATNEEVLLATMVGRRRKFFILNRLKRLEKLTICRKQVM